MLTITSRKHSSPFGSIEIVSVNNSNVNNWFPEMFSCAEKVIPIAEPQGGWNSVSDITAKVSTGKGNENPDVLLTIHRDLGDIRKAILGHSSRRELLDRTDTLLDHIENTLAEM